MAGRPASMQSEKMNPRIIDATISLWNWDNPEEEKGFTEIHKGLVKKGIVQKEQYKYKTARILEQLGDGTTEKKGLKLIKKNMETRKYSLNVEPAEFRIFDYLQTLRKKNHVARGRIGGAFWTSHDMYFLGMPDQVFNDKEGNYVLQILNVRLAELFNAYRALAAEMKTRKEGQSEGQPSGLPRTVIRQLLLELAPYYLGSRAGIDGDGLDMEELNETLTKMIQGLPEKIEVDEGWSASTQKDLILENLGKINALNLTYISNKKKAWKTTDELTETMNEDIEETTKENEMDFALIVTGPEHLIDSKGSAQRMIRDEIIEHGNEDESPFYLARLLLCQEREDVLKALEVYGRKYLGQEKCNRTREAYEKLYAANWLAEVITESHMRTLFKEETFNKREKSWVDKNIRKIMDDFGIKTLITYIPFSNSSMLFNRPTLEKEKAIHQFFPQVPAENIHEWLAEGAALASEIFECAWKNSQEKRDTARSPAQ